MQAVLSEAACLSDFVRSGAVVIKKLFQSVLIVSALSAIGFNCIAKEVTVQAQGRGMTYEEARTEALRDAIMQVSGVAIDADTVQKIASLSRNDPSGSVNIDETLFNQQLRERLKGYIKSFRILNQSQQQNEVLLNLSVTVERYEMPGINDTRRSISVQAFEASPGVCFGKSLSSESLTEGITEALQTAFVNTRKFSVLDRHSEAYQREKEFLQTNPDVQLSEQARLGLNRGSDYVLTGDVRNVRITQSNRKSQLANRTISTRSAHADVVFNLMLFATRQIKFSEAVTVDFSNNLAGKDCQQIVDEMFRQAAKEVAAKATQAIYPPVVVSYDGEDIIFNYGGSDIKLGSKFNLYRTGKVIYDPYTKESLGRQEKLLGTVTVVDVMPKASIARFDNPKSNLEARQGDILRPVQKVAAPKTTTKKKKSNLDDEW